MYHKINSLIDEIPNEGLSSSLLKAKILAYEIKNDKFTEWLNNELEGYEGKEIPAYRIVPTEVFGDLIQVIGNSFVTRNNFPLPYEGLERKLTTGLRRYGMMQSISELEQLLEQHEEDLKIILPFSVYNEFNKVFKNGWEVEQAWMRIGRSSIAGIISTAKFKLLGFLLELKDEIEKEGDIDVVMDGEKTQSIFEKTIGSVRGDNVNIFLGDNNIQSIIEGSNANVNIASGENIEQKISIENLEELKNFVGELKRYVDSLELGRDEKEDIKNEIIRIETQISREKPKYAIVKSAMSVIYEILTGVVGNLMTDPIMMQLGEFIS